MKLILTFALLLSFSTGLLGQQTYIPDTGFEEALIFEGLDSVLDDSISTSMIDTLTFLDLEPFGIIDLTGIEDFIALEVFVCRNNNIQQLDLSNNQNIEFLNCENNNITSLDVSNCPNLTQLFAEDNNLTNIDVTQNPLLETLELNLNGLGAINLIPNTELKTLRMVNTSLSSIDLSTNTLLENLDLSTNQLSTVDLTTAPNLKTLVIGGNSLTLLDLSGNPNLELLLAAHNDFIHIDFQNNPLVTYISCAYNDLESMILPPVDTTLLVNVGTIANPNLFCIQSDNSAYVNANWNVIIDTFTVISDLCNIGINELKSEVNIFPNPTMDGYISVQSEQNGRYQLFDLNGAQLQTGEINQETNSLDFSAFSTGFYILHLRLNTKLVTRRIEIF